MSLTVAEFTEQLGIDERQVLKQAKSIGIRVRRSSDAITKAAEIALRECFPAEQKAYQDKIKRAAEAQESAEKVEARRKVAQKKAVAKAAAKKKTVAKGPARDAKPSSSKAGIEEPEAAVAAAANLADEERETAARAAARARVREKAKAKVAIRRRKKAEAIAEPEAEEAAKAAPKRTGRVRGAVESAQATVVEAEPAAEVELTDAEDPAAQQAPAVKTVISQPTVSQEQAAEIAQAHTVKGPLVDEQEFLGARIVKRDFVKVEEPKPAKAKPRRKKKKEREKEKVQAAPDVAELEAKEKSVDGKRKDRGKRKKRKETEVDKGFKHFKIRKDRSGATYSYTTDFKSIIMPATIGVDTGIIGRKARQRPSHISKLDAQRLEEEKLAELEGMSIEVSLPATVKDLANAMGIKTNVIIKKLMEQGILITINQTLDAETIELVGVEFGVEVEVKKVREKEDVLEEIIQQTKVDQAETEGVTRAPVVTLLGHVDHGKTSLLDAIRKSNLVDREPGAITQTIGAYDVTIGDGKRIVFLDTPGHEAFTEMRARGANVTDIVVLVVAADDGVMPQTEEAISHARAAEVPIIVAVNKIDRPDADPLKARQQLAGFNLAAEDWGGETIFCEVSALKGDGVPELLEMISLQAEMLELTAHPERLAVGVCIESKVDKRGVVADLLVTDGTLNLQESILCGASHGRIRAMVDEQGLDVPEAGPSTPVEVLGLNAPPNPGDKFYVLDKAARAKEIAEERTKKYRTRVLDARAASATATLFARIGQTKVKEFRIVLKADVLGSVEVLKKALGDLSTDEVKVKFLHAAVGGINETDVLLAEASEGHVFGFRVAPEPRARTAAEQKNLTLHLYQIIYELIDDVKKAMSGLLEPDKKENITGHVEVRQIFSVSRVGTIAGSYVTDGVVKRASKIRLIRDSIVILPREGDPPAELDSLKRFKDDAREVKEGFECGVKIKGFDDVKAGDVIEAYDIELVERTL